ncbi:MAG: hypothetical protein KAT44_11700, partial [Pirellulales bacterium]|nr:hypothetical protein [Pirellulales bacterium]
MSSSRTTGSRPAAASHAATATAVRKKQASKAKKVLSKKKNAASAVHTVEVRPAGTIVEHQPPVKPKREAVFHVPHQLATVSKPPAWMLEQCHVSPARAGDQSEIIQLLSGLP